VPTLLPLLGVKNPVSDYSSGRGLFDRTPRPFVPSFSWDTAAIIKNGEVLEMPLEAYKGGVKAYDSEYREEDKKAAAAFSPLIPAFHKEAKKFSK
jgi:membrane-anchored protein YejM (alkaline phosphatase superfamily)